MVVVDSVVVVGTVVGMSYDRVSNLFMSRLTCALTLITVVIVVSVVVVGWVTVVVSVVVHVCHVLGRRLHETRFSSTYGRFCSRTGLETVSQLLIRKLCLSTHSCRGVRGGDRGCVCFCSCAGLEIVSRFLVRKINSSTDSCRSVRGSDRGGIGFCSCAGLASVSRVLAGGSELI